MIQSQKYGEYKFPGEGIEKNESHLDTLLRETREETELHIIPSSVKEYGETLIIRKGINQNEIFEQDYDQTSKCDPEQIRAINDRSHVS